MIVTLSHKIRPNLQTGTLNKLMVLLVLHGIDHWKKQFTKFLSKLKGMQRSRREKGSQNRHRHRKKSPRSNYSI